jgi:hypothetical protein
MCGAFAEGKTPTFGEAPELGARRWMLQGYRSNREKTHVNSLCEWDVGHNRVLLGEKGVDEVGSVERNEVASFFADTDVAHGKAEFAGDGDYDATFRGAVEFG